MIKCSDCGIEGIHACLGKPVKQEDLPEDVSLFDSSYYPICGLELTVDQKIQRTVNNMPWHNKGTTPKKGEKMKMTSENFYRVIAMRDELIDDQRKEISKLKVKINKLQQKVDRLQ